MIFEVILTIVPIVIGVILGYGLSWGTNFWNQRRERKKYSKVFSFELQQLNDHLKPAIQRYDRMIFQMQNLSEEGLEIEDVRESIDIEYPNEVLQRYDFKSKYTFLNKNFEKISIFRDDTIKSIIKINSLMEEYDALSRGSEKFFSITNLRAIQKELQITLQHLENE